MACKYFYDGAGALIAVDEHESKEDREQPRLEAVFSQSNDNDKRDPRAHLSVVADNTDR